MVGGLGLGRVFESRCADATSASVRARFSHRDSETAKLHLQTFESFFHAVVPALGMYPPCALPNLK